MMLHCQVNKQNKVMMIIIIRLLVSKETVMLHQWGRETKSLDQVVSPHNFMTKALAAEDNYFSLLRH